MGLREQRAAPRSSPAWCFLSWGWFEAGRESAGPTYTCSTPSLLPSQPRISAALPHPLTSIHLPQPLPVEKIEGGKMASVPDALQSALLSVFPVVGGFSQPGHSWSPAVRALLDFNRHTDRMGTHAAVHTQNEHAGHRCPCAHRRVRARRQAPPYSFYFIPPFKAPPLSRIPHSRAAFPRCDPPIPPAAQHQLPSRWVIAAPGAAQRNARLCVPEVAQQRPSPGWMLY